MGIAHRDFAMLGYLDRHDRGGCGSGVCGGGFGGCMLPLPSQHFKSCASGHPICTGILWDKKENASSLVAPPIESTERLKSGG
tara:strand:- start:1913 stop:2161 length:249 start_codon:yes stop_codon:yes gene_type:complete